MSVFSQSVMCRLTEGVRPTVARFVFFGIVLAFLASPGHPVYATDQLLVEEGKSIVLQYREKIETVSLANDEIADVAAITADELVVIGKRTGTTSLVVWGVSMEYTAYEIKVVRNFSGLQVLLEVQIGEVNRNASSELGFDFLWGNEDLTEGQATLGSYAGAVGAGVTGLFHFIGRANEVDAVVHALQERGDLKLLATPKLLSLSGETASFLSGGEIPIPIAQSTLSGGQTITVEWKEYGVRLNFVPTVIDSGLISLTLEPEVSSLDFTNSVVIGGFAIPALLTRRAKTTVELRSAEVMYLGGLVSNEQVKTHRRVPILGHIPLLGALFTRKEVSTRETELVIIISPRIIGPASKETIPSLPWNGIKEETGDQSDVPSETGDVEGSSSKQESEGVSRHVPNPNHSR